MHKEEVLSRLVPVLSLGGKFREYLKSSDYVISNNAAFEFYQTEVSTLEESINSKTSIIEHCLLDQLKDQSIFDRCKLFFLSGYDFMIYDEQGLPVPRALYCDYINSIFNNTELVGLRKVINHIKDHPWVINPNDLEIRDVPYYNNEDGNRKYIENLYLCPSDQEWVELVEKETKNEKCYGKRAKDYVYHRRWEEYDPLEIAQFIRPKINEYDDD